MPASFRQSAGASMIWSRSASWLLRTRFCERRYRLDEFAGGDDGIGVVRDVDVERGVHRLVRIIRSRVPDHCDVVAQFRGKAYRRFDTRVCDEPDDDEPLDAVPLELEIQVRIGKAARAQRYRPLAVRIRCESRLPTCRTRSSFVTTRPSERAQCTSRFRSRRGDSDEEAHRAHVAARAAPHRGPPSCEEYSCWPLPHLSSGPRLSLPRK